MKFIIELNSLPHKLSSFLGLHLLDLSGSLTLRFLPVKSCSCNLLLMFFQGSIFRRARLIVVTNMFGDGFELEDLGKRR